MVVFRIGILGGKSSAYMPGKEFLVAYENHTFVCLSVTNHVSALLKKTEANVILKPK